MPFREIVFLNGEDFLKTKELVLLLNKLWEQYS